MLAYAPTTLVTASIDIVAPLQDSGVPYVAGTERALEVISALHDYRQHQRRFRSGDGRSVGRPTIAMRPDLPAGVLPFMTAREILTEFGVPVVATELATTREEAVEAAAKLGYPVALKVEARGLTHKSDIGGVVLGCGDAATVSAAFDRAMARVARAGFTDVSGMLVQPMCPFAVETIAGVSVDPVFGPGLLFGLGGVFVEVLKETVNDAPPLSLEQAKQVVLGIRARKILEGVRGRPPADLDAVARVLVALGDFALVYRDRLTAVDVNPLLVGEVGTGVVAVDLVVELNDRGA
jgi:acyl-CoA synthetase (NDP forming)